MIDFIKIYSLPITIDDLVNNPNLVFQLNVNESGEFNAKDQHCTFNELIISINKTKGTRKMQGSLHKHWNGGLHNHNDFTFKDVCSTLLKIENTFRIDTSKCTLNNLEYGVNIRSEIFPTELINDLIQHVGKTIYTHVKGYRENCKTYTIHNQSLRQGDTILSA